MLHSPPCVPRARKAVLKKRRGTRKGPEPVLCAGAHADMSAKGYGGVSLTTLAGRHPTSVHKWGGRALGMGTRWWRGYSVWRYDGTNKVVPWDVLENGLLHAAPLVNCPAWTLQKLEEREDFVIL